MLITDMGGVLEVCDANGSIMVRLLVLDGRHMLAAAGIAALHIGITVWQQKRQMKSEYDSQMFGENHLMHDPGPAC